ncbi:MAG: hypothetical protein JW839_17930 [Candidatus Lokiarchaeota archaeon]|nr:hypothetical protein [Candidatus Lokiarchaeota archaeon]
MDRIDFVKRIVGLGTGATLIVISVLMLLSGTRIPGAYLDYTISIGGTDKDFQLDLTLFIYFVIMFIGLGAVMVALKPSRLPDSVIVSYPVSRLIAGLLLFAMGVFFLVEYGVEFGGYNDVGNWFFLGGFSMFFPTGAFPLLVGAILLVISAFTYMKLNITRTPDHLVIDEMRFPRSMSVKIPLQDIQAMRLTNGRTGMRFLWVILFIIPVYFLYVDGFSFILNPDLYGMGTCGIFPFMDGAGECVGLAYLLSATVQLACMLLIVINSHYTIEIVTTDKLIEIPYYPINYKSLKRSNLAHVLFDDEGRGLPGEPVASIKQAGDVKRLACGALFVIIGIASRVFYLWAGEMLRFVLLIAGIIIFVDSMKNDLKFVNSRVDVRAIDEGRGYLLSGTGWLFKNDLYFQGVRQLSDCRKEDVVAANMKVQPRKLSIIDHLLVTAILFFIGFQGFPVGLLVPASMAGFMAARVGLVILTCAAIALAIMLNPVHVFKVKLGDCNFQVPVKMAAVQGVSPLVSLFINFFRKYKMAWQTHRVQMLWRMAEMAIAAGVGMLVSAIMLFV